MQPSPPASTPGVAVALAPGLTRVLAPNPSPMTLHGTNTYLLGETRLVVIDPGPDSSEHLAALERAIDGRPVEAILATHAHLDHTPLCPRLSDLCGAPVHGFGPYDAGRRPVMARLSQEVTLGGGEGVDAAFTPDQILTDGAVLETEHGPLEALHLPGHMANHMGFAWNDMLFCGDHVMGWASSLVSPPDGDLTAFMASCNRLLARPEQIYHPGHGDPIADGPARVRWLIAHRQARTTQTLNALEQGPAGLQDLTRRVYTDIDPKMLPAAARNLLAHLLALAEEGVVTATPSLSPEAVFALSDSAAHGAQNS